MPHNLNTRLQRLEQLQGGRAGFIHINGAESEALARQRYLSDHKLSEGDISVWFILEK